MGMKLELVVSMKINHLSLDDVVTRKNEMMTHFARDNFSKVKNTLVYRTLLSSHANKMRHLLAVFCHVMSII